MRYGLMLAAMLLSGCYAAPPDTGYAAPGYPPGYAQPGYPLGYAQPGYPPGSYQPPPYDPNAGAYPGYGVPAYAGPPVLLDGQWGFYDQERHWHRGPDGDGRRFDQDRREGGRDDHFRTGPGAEPRGPAAFHAPESARPAATQAAAPRPAAPPPRQEPHERTRFCPTGQHC